MNDTNKWPVIMTDLFTDWYDNLDDVDRKNVLAVLLLIEKIGPLLGRPYADNVKDSSNNKLKEGRVQSKGKPIRFFFAFDHKRRAVILCAGHKKGKKFYQKMIRIAEQEYEAHLVNNI